MAPIHFDEFEEIEETPDLKRDTHKNNLVFPNDVAHILSVNNQDEEHNRVQELTEKSKREDEIKMMLEL